MTANDPHSSVTKDRKRVLRAELIQVRARLSREERADRSRSVAERAASIPELMAARTVALYAPLNTEADPAEIGRRLLASGARIVYPRVQPTGRILAFAACEPQALVPGPLGALEPPADARHVELEDLEAVLMPGVAFSEDGLRLGRGGGYYDATLKMVPERALRIGLGFDVQVVPALPREPHDVPLDLVVTDVRTLRFAR
ncbi:MAG: 5-formyltetrahydrofolate cyclo-ligase [Anaeromyxobacteraceae bacterium]